MKQPGSVARRLYSLFMGAVEPLLRRRLVRRGRAEPGYLEHMGERFGHYDNTHAPVMQGGVWVHAVSLGETRAAAALIARLRELLPGMRLLLTHGTATGRAEGRRLLQDGDIQVWQPWDTPGGVRRFLSRFRPRVGILMETEVWPNMVAGCAAAGIPLLLANARLSDKSRRQALRLAWLSRPAFSGLAAVWAQTEADAARLRQLGAPVKGVFGNVKFDAQPNMAQLAQGRRWAQAWRQATGRAVVMLASSREGEEQLLLEILEKKVSAAPANPGSDAIKKGASVDTSMGIQWLIVPRHPQRFDEVRALAEHHGQTVSRRSTWGDGPSYPETSDVVWLGDSLGEMALYYGMADAVLLGGSFAPLGGQNLIEAAACGCPVIMGPHTFNFLEAAELAIQAGAARRADSLNRAVQQALALTCDPVDHAAMSAAALAFAQAHRGATQRTAEAVVALLD